MDLATNTRTSERVESRVETVEVTEYQCSNCGQWYDDESEIVPVALNAEADAPADVDEVAALCDGCAEAVFDYEGSGDASLSALRKAVFPSAEREMVKSLQQTLVKGLITVIIGGVSLFVALQVSQEVQQAAASGEFEQAAAQTVTSTGAGGLMGIFGPVMILVIGVVVVSYIRYMPRRF